MHEVPDQAGRLIVVTGANGGIGKEAYPPPWRPPGRMSSWRSARPRRASRRAEILAAVPTAGLDVRRVDLADLASVREFADGLVADGTPVDVLINNAGVMAPPSRQARDTAVAARLWDEAERLTGATLPAASTHG